jgi:FHA domain
MRSGTRRHDLDLTLRDAYGEGLLSYRTFVDRLELLVTPGLIDPDQLVGDLTLRGPHTPVSRARARAVWLRERAAAWRAPALGAALLALDWSGATERLLVGRAGGCDILLDDLQVSRLHAWLIFRDGAWVVQDLRSKNGTTLNGSPVVRGRLAPGDRIAFAGQRFRID